MVYTSVSPPLIMNNSLQATNDRLVRSLQDVTTAIVADASKRVKKEMETYAEQSKKELNADFQAQFTLLERTRKEATLQQAAGFQAMQTAHHEDCEHLAEAVKNDREKIAYLEGQLTHSEQALEALRNSLRQVQKESSELAKQQAARQLQTEREQLGSEEAISNLQAALRAIEQNRSKQLSTGPNYAMIQEAMMEDDMLDDSVNFHNFPSPTQARSPLPRAVFRPDAKQSTEGNFRAPYSFLKPATVRAAINRASDYSPAPSSVTMAAFDGTSENIVARPRSIPKNATVPPVGLFRHSGTSHSRLTSPPLPPTQAPIQPSPGSAVAIPSFKHSDKCQCKLCVKQQLSCSTKRAREDPLPSEGVGSEEDGSEGSGERVGRPKRAVQMPKRYQDGM